MAPVLLDKASMALLVGYPPSTARAYLVDLKAWGVVCAGMSTNPFDARRHHIDVWVRQLSTEPLPRTGRPMAPASIALSEGALTSVDWQGSEIAPKCFRCRAELINGVIRTPQ
ncbi:MAG TPA: hypothetical protein VIU87_19335 [Mycobacterium sp.]